MNEREDAALRHEQKPAERCAVSIARSEERLAALARAIGEAERILIYSHMNPDPDTVGSALALRFLLERAFGRTVTVCYRGMIGRAENRQLLRTVGREMVHAATLRQEEFDLAFLVDSQPDYGLHVGKDEVPLIGVIDHHPIGKGLEGIPFVDVRPEYGSTSTILSEYLLAARLLPDDRIATALFYGLKTDTMDLSRRTSPADRAAYARLQPILDRELLCRIENPPLSAEYFEKLVAALGRAVVYRGIVLTEIGRMPYADMVAEVADRIIMLEGMDWGVCFGSHDRRLYLSVRSSQPSLDAGRVVQKVLEGRGVGGGHDRMAAGRLQLEFDTEDEYVSKVTDLWSRFLQTLGEDAASGRRLVADYPYPQRVVPTNS